MLNFLEMEGYTLRICYLGIPAIIPRTTPPRINQVEFTLKMVSRINEINAVMIVKGSMSETRLKE